ncbi:SPOC domain-like protein [Ceraceosorus guamensis]|uniref:DNA helicase n=1 Tax=Ceraceosorus guamensis TaxID=1522189 RepID=A0A316VZR2_9BASI|nr:SPOC domain-like protein [Ceraceosorus guamensis]PWN41771.1 SPOC domain-like protein [Ceraceosorus guamensis]
MSLASTITTFLIDVSPSMGALRTVAEDVEDADDQEETTRLDEGDRVRAEDGMDGELNDGHGPKRTSGEWKVRERETSNLQWACEFVGRRVQTYVHAGLKTGKVCLITYGSATTNNAVAGDGTTKQEYLGINEMFSPAQPDLNTCELVRALRASKDSEEPHRADPLDALIAAICTLTDKDRGGINSSSKNTWSRTIYLITDAMTKFNQDDSALIQQRLEEENIQLKVIGIDFDDEGFGYVEEDKPSTKAKNEQFWHDFLSRVPGSGIATAADVIEQTHMPQLAPKKSAAQNATLTFGDPEEQHLSQEVLGIAVVLYKATTLVRPMSAKKLSKIAQQSAAGKAEMERAAQLKIEPSSAPKLQPNQELEGSNPAFIDSEAHAMSYGVDMVRKYFILDEIRQLPEEEMDSAQPLPEGSEENFIKAWKLGKSHIPVEQVQDVVFATQAGLEIIQFHNREQLRRWFVMGETSYVLASPGNGEAQLKISALVKAMIELGKIALVRNVKKRDADPKLAALIPIPKDPESGSEADHFVYAEVPFANDFKRLIFPPLEYVVDRNGVEHREHHLLPTREMQSAMDDLVDSMDLMEAYEEPDG